MPTETLTSPELAEDTSFNPSELEQPDGDQLLQEVSEFIGRYLQSSEHQRTIMALWALHTHCLPVAQVTPYLSIQSAEKQSGKSLCLQLLSLLCNSPALTASFTINTLTRRLDDKSSTILFDECQAILGTRARSKGPVLRAILASGFHRGIGYTDSTHERNIFSPKAFAGMGQLPEALASRSIPIILQPWGGAGISCLPLKQGGSLGLQAEEAKIPNKDADCNAVTHSQKIERFSLYRASAEAKPLEERLSLWAAGNLPMLKEMPSYSRADFPAGLSPRRQDMIEPFLQLADFIGAEWPSRIREALLAAFEEEAAFQLRLSLQLLADIRDCFAHHDYPQRLSTATLLDWTHTRPARPWDVDGPITARTIARLLAPFEIHPRVQRIPGAPTARGYQLNDFKELWKTHFNFEVPPEPTSAEMRQRFQSALAAGAKSKEPTPLGAQAHNGGVSASSGSLGSRGPLGRREPGTGEREEVFPNKDAACNAVTHPDSISKISADQRQSVVKDPDLPVSPKAAVFPQEQLSEEFRIPPQNAWQNGHNAAQPSSL